MEILVSEQHGLGGNGMSNKPNTTLNNNNFLPPYFKNKLGWSLKMIICKEHRRLMWPSNHLGLRL